MNIETITRKTLGLQDIKPARKKRDTAPGFLRTLVIACYLTVAGMGGLTAHEHYSAAQTRKAVESSEQDFTVMMAESQQLSSLKDKETFISKEFEEHQRWLSETPSLSPILKAALAAVPPQMGITYLNISKVPNQDAYQISTELFNKGLENQAFSEMEENLKRLGFEVEGIDNEVNQGLYQANFKVFTKRMPGLASK